MATAIASQNYTGRKVGSLLTALFTSDPPPFARGLVKHIKQQFLVYFFVPDRQHSGYDMGPGGHVPAWRLGEFILYT